jgi:hypothetical protein
MWIKMTARSSIVIFALSILWPMTSQAALSPTPSPTVQSLPLGISARTALTKLQKIALAAANATFALARANARAGFDRAVADAIAVRDQAIADAGKDKIVIKSARENYQDFYKSISHAYKIALIEATNTRKSALAAAHIPPRTN